jgi:hypothetical protein
MMVRVLDTFYLKVEGLRKMKMIWRRAMKMSTLTMSLCEGEVRAVPNVIPSEKTLILRGVSIVVKGDLWKMAKLYLSTKISTLTEMSYLTISS